MSGLNQMLLVSDRGEWMQSEECSQTQFCVSCGKMCERTFLELPGLEHTITMRIHDG